MSIKSTKEMLDGLILTTPEVLEQIKIKEEAGLLNDHVDTIHPELYEPVKEDFKYLKKDFKTSFYYFFLYHFCVVPFEYRELKRMGYKVEGRENLKGISSAVVTSNHINKLDCSLLRHAFKGHKLYITAAKFNNMKGLLGDIMRCSRMMPLGDGYKAMKNFDNAVNTLLGSKKYVLFYPEQSEWWCYKKPRPLMPGAFHYAIKNNVPVIPSFITFKENGKKDQNGIELYDMTVHILKPIYPDKSLPKSEALKIMLDENYKQYVECYEKTYHKKLTFSNEKH